MEPDDNPSTERVDPQVDAAQFSFTSSWPIGKIAEALAKAQGEMRAAEQDARNPHFGNKYGTIASVMDSVRGPLSANGIAVVQIPQGKTLVSMLVHSSGQFFRGTMDVKPVQDTPQGWGSAWKYARRYSLEALTCATTRHDPEDDDAEEASKPKATTAKKEAPHPAAADRHPDTDHICPIHKTPFKLFERPDGAKWYSHKVGSEWCNETAATAQAPKEGTQDTTTLEEVFGPADHAPEPASATTKPAGGDTGGTLDEDAFKSLSIQEMRKEILNFQKVDRDRFGRVKVALGLTSKVMSDLTADDCFRMAKALLAKD